MIAQISNPTAEFEIPIGALIIEGNTETETHPQTRKKERTRKERNKKAFRVI